MTSSAATPDQITLDANALVKGCGCAYCQNDQGAHDHFQDGSENPIFEAAVLNGGGGEYTPASVGQNNADELIHGYEWGPGGGTGVSLTYSFPTSIPSYYSPYAPEQNNFSAFTTEMQNAVRSVMSHIETFIDVSFTEVSGTGDITFAQARLPNDNTLAYAYYPDQADYSGDVWFNNLYLFSPAMDAGEVGYFIAMHEIGHALGLIHSFEAGLTGAEDSEQYTVLSYDTSPWGSTLSAETYMLYDIAALQSIYGANTTYNTGDDIYILDPNAAYTVWDAGGTDTFNSSAVSSDVIIRLEEGGFSSVGLDQNIAIAYGTIIENATTGAGDDLIYANAAANIINGGAGSDTVNYSLGDAVSIDLLYGSASNGLAQGDTLTSIENIIGSDSSDSTQRDWLWGDAQNNHFEGLSGNDILEGGAGADIIDGGAGWDYARYTRSSAGVTINLETGVHTGGDAQGDTLIDIEAVTGSAHNDNITGNSTDDYLLGENGDDYLYGGAGNDQLIGGNGNDTYVYYSGLDSFREWGSDLNDRVIFDSAYSPLDLTLSENKIIFDIGVNELSFNDINAFDFFAFDGYDDMSLAELEDLLDGEDGIELTPSTEIFVNTYTDGYQGNPVVSGLPNGDFIVVWEGRALEFVEPVGQTTHLGIHSQRFAADGSKIGDAVLHDYDYPESYLAPMDPTIAVLNDGSPVIAWEIDNTYSAEYAPSVSLNGDIFSGLNPSLSALPDGGYILVWDDIMPKDGINNFVYGMANTGTGVSAQKYAADGSEVGDKILITTYPENKHYDPSVTVLTNGGFVVTWERDATGSGDTSDVYARVYTPEGTPTGNEFIVNTYTTGQQSASSITGLSDGGFVITWESNGQDGDGDGIYGQRYAADGTTLGNAFQINSETAGDQSIPAVTALNNGEFVVTWHGDGSQDGDSYGVFGQRYAANGLKIGDEFLINSHTENGQFLPSVAALANGGFVVTWESAYQDGSDGSVIAKTFQPFPIDTDDVFIGTAATETFYGMGGSDTVDYSDGNAVSIDLLNGSVSGGFAQGDTLDSIENIIGSDSSDSAQRDWLWGDAQDNHFEGLGGNDLLEGGAGADIIDGGAGWDYARYTRSSTGVTINLETGVNTGGDAQGDTLINIEAIVGSSHNDTLIGGASNDYLRGENGNDYLRGGAGSDQMIGGAHNDTYMYDEGRDRIIETGTGIDRVAFSAVWSPEDVTISGNEFIFTPNLDTIIFNDISLIEFFAFDGFADMSLMELEDYLDSLTDTGTGTAGDDTFIATNAAEAFDGLGGSDTVDYSASSDAVIIDLLNNTATGGDAQGDSFTSIENIIGSNNSALRDTIYGDAAINLIDGKDGADILEGGAGADVINGGGGWDYSRYTRSSAGVNINLETGVNTGGDAEGDTLINIEAVVGSNHNDTLIGGTSNDFLRGENGDDVLAGGDGRDQLYGGNGADTFIFHAITAFNDIDLLRDFKITDGDILDLSDVLQGYDAVSDAITDFVQITESGGNTIVSVDANGGGDAFLQIATITGLHSMTDEEGLENSGNLITV